MKLSIIIPIFNEEKTIEKTMAEVLNSSIDFEKEIILIDDGSTDGTRGILEKYKLKHTVVLMDKNNCMFKFVLF